MNKLTSDHIFKFISFPLLLVIAFMMIFPVYILVKVSISEPSEVNTDHPTFLVHDFTLEHWKNIILTDKKTESGQIVYKINIDELTVESEKEEQIIITPDEQYTINGVTRKLTFLDGEMYKLNRSELQKVRDVSTTKKIFFGEETVQKLYLPIWKSFSVATLTTIIAIIIAAPASYVISRMPKSIGYMIILGLLFTRMFPDVGIALPIATRFVSWQLTDSTFGLILAHLIPNLPFLAWILVGTFQVIPRDVEKSAMIDGAGRITTLRKIIFPIAAPGIAVGAMFVWLNSWNEFLYARYLTTVEGTLPIKTFEIITTGSYFTAAAYSTILTIPIIIITFYLQRYLKSGMLSGAVK
ncbi:carbohydrate ABC transporter permease [Chengkuizengella marina]|nr:carbohydrate ABC transporter permease [Chengkuizengella marina]